MSTDFSAISAEELLNQLPIEDDRWEFKSATFLEPAKKGEFNGIRIEAREDSFINATQMCKAAKKKWAKYKENQSTHEFFEALSQKLQCPISDIVISQVGGDRSGTWVHRRIAIHLAQWCNAKFAVWVTGQIERIIDGRQVAHREHAEASFYEALFNKLVEGQNQLIQGHLDSSKRINRIEDDVSQVKDDVRAIRSEISHKRKNFSNSAKNAAIACLQEYSRNGVVCCPCCDRPTNEVEFHHWQQKGGNNQFRAAFGHVGDTSSIPSGGDRPLS